MKRLPSLRGEGKMNMWSGENLSLSLGDYTLCNQKPSERGGAGGGGQPCGRAAAPQNITDSHSET